MTPTLPTTNHRPNYAQFKTAKSLLLALVTDTVSASIRIITQLLTQRLTWTQSIAHYHGRVWPVTTGACVSGPVTTSALLK